jgi:phage/plasmid-like protein (TIGR03299 family)
MAHEISIQNGVAEMAYVGKTPWHGLGYQLPASASIEHWIEAAHLDWKYLANKVHFFSADEEDQGPVALNDYSKKKVIYRSDNKSPLAVVGGGYELVQPNEVMEFFRDLTEFQGFTLETAGALFDGRTIWALAKTSFEQEVVEGDPLKQYLLLSTSCDGTSATTARYTSVRVVCNNTLQMAGAKSTNVMKFRHNKRFDPDIVKDKLGLNSKKVFDAFMLQTRQLSNVKMSYMEGSEFIQKLLPKVQMNGGPDSRAHKHIMQLFQGAGKGSRLEGVLGTRWGMINAITEYLDFHTATRTDQARLQSSWFGKGNKMKEKGLEMLLA